LTLHTAITLAKEVDSLGFNERELIDLLEVIGETDLVDECEKDTNSVNLFKGMRKIFQYTNCSRIQLHMFGLYLTMQKKGHSITPVQNRNGMQLAAVIAAAKAGTGAIDSHDVLLWAKDKQVSDVGINELSNLADFIKPTSDVRCFVTDGICSTDEADIIAVPTIIIDKPITLVGMGDTISSISLVASN